MAFWFCPRPSPKSQSGVRSWAREEEEWGRSPAVLHPLRHRPLGLLRPSRTHVPLHKYAPGSLRYQWPHELRSL